MTQTTRMPVRMRTANRPSMKEPLIYGAATLAVIFAVWYLATGVLQLVAPSFLPSPTSVVERFVSLLIEPFSGSTLLGHAGSSLQRWGLGLLWGVGLGVPLGAFLAWLPPIRPVVEPVFELLRYIPPFAWIPIAVLWMGAGIEAQATVVFIAAFPACVINSQLGVSQVDPLLLKASRSLGASSFYTLRWVALPVAAPDIFIGIRIALSNGWMALVGAELIVGQSGLGFLIHQGQYNGSTSTIIVGMITIGVIGALLDVLMQRSQKFLMPWRKPQTEGK